MTAAIHPELRAVARVLPDVPTSPTALAVLRRLARFAPIAGLPRGVTHTARTVPASTHAPAVEVHCFHPAPSREPTPALLWMHGGGYVLGHPRQDAALCADFASALGITVVAPRYRLAPDDPHPAALEDCYAALRWLRDEAASLGVDATRLAIGGASAGGGLCAALALLARDRGGPALALQLLVYPMLDDRTALRDDLDETGYRLWRQRNNRLGWGAYLGRAPGGEGVPCLAAAARCEDLTGVAPAWLGVGTLDLFYDEDLRYAARLEAQGARCERTVVDGAFHGFDAVAPWTAVARSFREAQRGALRRALFGAPAP